MEEDPPFPRESSASPNSTATHAVCFLTTDPVLSWGTDVGLVAAVSPLWLLDCAGLQRLLPPALEALHRPMAAWAWPVPGDDEDEARGVSISLGGYRSGLAAEARGALPGALAPLPLMHCAKQLLFGLIDVMNWDQSITATLGVTTHIIYANTATSKYM